MIEFEIPVKTINESNGQHGHWRVKANRRKVQRKTSLECCWWAFNNNRPQSHPFPCIITLIRQSAGTLDDDNLRTSLKSVRDGIADAYGLPDNDKRFTWRYDQEKSKRGVYGVRVRIESV